MESKGIKSVRSRVTNISEYLEKSVSVDEFFQSLLNHFKKNTLEYKLTEEDIAKINRLATEKYSTYEWNIGKSPKGKNRFDGRFNFGTISITFDSIDGKLENVEIFGDFFAKKDVSELSNKLCGLRFSFEDVKSVLVVIDDFIEGANGEEIAKKMFE
jgi:lipoate-protein ligase A